MRDLAATVFWLPGFACGWLWFGSSGLALVLLWFVARRQGSRFTRAECDWHAVCCRCRETRQLSFAHVAPHRILLVFQGVGRIEVYRDEVTGAEWAALRRFCFTESGAQPATGRSTLS